MPRIWQHRDSSPPRPRTSVVLTLSGTNHPNGASPAPTPAGHQRPGRERLLRQIKCPNQGHSLSLPFRLHLVTQASAHPSCVKG